MQHLIVAPANEERLYFLQHQSSRQNVQNLNCYSVVCEGVDLLRREIYISRRETKRHTRKGEIYISRRGTETKHQKGLTPATNDNENNAHHHGEEQTTTTTTTQNTWNKKELRKETTTHWERVLCSPVPPNVVREEQLSLSATITHLALDARHLPRGGNPFMFCCCCLDFFGSRSFHGVCPRRVPFPSSPGRRRLAPNNEHPSLG